MKIIIVLVLLSLTVGVNGAEVVNSIPEIIWSDFVPSKYAKRNADIHEFLQYFETVLRKEVDPTINIYMDLVITKSMIKMATKKVNHKSENNKSPLPSIEITREKTFRDVLDLCCVVLGGSWKQEGNKILIIGQAGVGSKKSSKAPVKTGQE